MALCASGAPLRAQPEPFIFHVYVDPIYGDDQLADNLNPTDPSGLPLRQVLASYPAGFPDNAGAPGFLQHAPYSFRTLTGGTRNPGGGALGYVDRVFPPQSVGSWAYNGNTVEFVVIHCLPGLYGPDSSINPTLWPDDFDTVDTATPSFGSQLRYNGEIFPIRLRDRISIQGASALDTIFDARLGQTAIFEALSAPGGVGVGLGPVFVDSVTVRGARSDGMAPWNMAGTRNRSGAGFYIGREGSNRLTISNCFIVDNSVGIAMENDTQDPTPDNVVSPVIVNNTIAWNTIGIWSGNAPPPAAPQQPRIAIAQPIILNNIIDPGPPGEIFLNTTCLGLHPWDLTVIAPQMGSFNAYPDNTEQQGAGIGNFLAADAQLRLPMVAFPPPRVDLADFMPSLVQPRGLLYINDAFRLAGDVPERAPHDFRLSPHSADAGVVITPQNPVVDTNPLVNMGLSIGSASAIATITFANHVRAWDLVSPEPAHNEIGGPPGYTAVPGEPDRFHAWDWDCDGFGNPRVRCRAGFANFGDPPVPGEPLVFDNIDLGADEMDALIISGYPNRTRMFAAYPDGVPANPAIQLNPMTELFFFDLRTNPGPVHPRPMFNVEVGVGYYWWEHARDVEQASDAVPVIATWLMGSPQIPTNYTDVSMTNLEPVQDPPITLPVAFRRIRIRLSGNITLIMPPPLVPEPIGQPVIMRNLFCDFSPSLIGDPHPLWGSAWFGFPNTPFGAADLYAANPWHGEPAGFAMEGMPPAAIPSHNWTCYRRPGPAQYAGGVLDGTISPPFTWWDGTPPPECGTLGPIGFLTSAPTVPLAVGFACSPLATTYTIGAFGFGDTVCPDQFVPLLPWWGIRFNCQIDLPNDRSNLQTFLMVHGEIEKLDASAPGAESASNAVGPGTHLPGLPIDWPKSTREERRSLMQRLMRR